MVLLASPVVEIALEKQQLAGRKQTRSMIAGSSQESSLPIPKIPKDRGWDKVSVAEIKNNLITQPLRFGPPLLVAAGSADNHDTGAVTEGARCSC
ncbi:hypothetical protein F4695_003811 [Rhizobium soli]|uniref:Uncharacterized protein n=1 Tax=Rhizobium soli TaxID=424798 RepID=A0A7X0MSX5_9HYPH|nr:hypothetical protein [Rhizobium soli]